MAEEISYEQLYETYEDNVKCFEKLNKRYKKLKKSHNELMKTFESIVKIYCEDKSISELNSHSHDFIEVKDLITKFIPKFKFEEYQLDFEIPEKTISRIEKLNENVSSKRILMFTLATNSNNIIKKHICYNTNKEYYLKSQQIHDSQIILETDFDSDEDRKITKKMITKNIISPTDISATFICDDIELLKEEYIE